jgi:hypothetical protein
VDDLQAFQPTGCRGRNANSAWCGLW